MEPGARRERLDRMLRDAYSRGLLSESTFIARLDCVLSDRVVDPPRIVGDLALRSRRSIGSNSRRLLSTISARLHPRASRLLALDWSEPTRPHLLIGREPRSDIVIEDADVSRHHDELLWRDGAWVVHDLGSRNGTSLNGAKVQRAQLRPGDFISFASQRFQID